MDSEKYNTLVKKCNLQLTKIQELEKKIKEQNLYISSIEKNHQQEINRNFSDVVMAFCNLVDNAIRNNQFIDVQKRTKINSKYSPINYNYIRDFIRDSYPKMDIKITLKWWKELGFLYANKNNEKYKLNYTFQGKTIQCLKIKNTIINAIKTSILEELNA